MLGVDRPDVPVRDPGARAVVERLGGHVGGRGRHAREDQADGGDDGGARAPAAARNHGVSLGRSDPPSGGRRSRSGQATSRAALADLPETIRIAAASGGSEHQRGPDLAITLLEQGDQLTVGADPAMVAPGSPSTTAMDWPYDSARASSSSSSRTGNVARAASASGTTSIGRSIGSAASSSSDRATSRPYPPTRVRRRAVRWPPTPSPAPRSRASART